MDEPFHHLRRLIVPPRAAVAALVSVPLALGCGVDSQRDADRDTLRILYFGDEWVFSPNWDVNAKFALFLPLVRPNGDGEIEGMLARSWEHSEDGRTWTIHLRSDVTWHDGVPFTAHDVLFTHELKTHPAVGWESPGARTVEVIDDTTYTVTYHRWAGEPISTWAVFYPRHVLRDLDPEEYYTWDFWLNPVGNGPYRWSRHMEKTMVELRANPDFFLGEPAIDRVILVFGAAQGLTELRAGNVDALGWVEGREVLTLVDEPGYRVTHSVHDAFRSILWKTSDPLFADARVRRALTLAVDRRQLHALLGWPDDLPLLDGVVTRSQFHDRGRLPDPIPYDPDRARRLLAEAGWSDSDGDGVLDRDGRPFRFTLVAPADQRQTSVFVQSQLARVGVDMEVSSVEINVVRNHHRSGDFQALLAWVDRTRADEFFGAEGVTELDHPRVSEVLERLGQVVDPDERERLYAEIYPVFREEQPALFLLPNVIQFVVPTWLEGLSSPFQADPLSNLWRLRVAE